MPSRLEAVLLPGPAGALEGLLHERGARTDAWTAVVCHPHPLHGGTMHNKVVHRLGSVLHALGAAVLRFNFRGVGRSEGRFDGEEGELEDARAALQWLRMRHPGRDCWAAGFSFGSWIAARLAASEPEVRRVILVSPPVATSDFSALRTAAAPKLVVQGTLDQVCPPAALEREFPTWAEPKIIRFVNGANHLFDKQLGALAEVLREAMAPPADGSVSPRP